MDPLYGKVSALMRFFNGIEVKMIGNAIGERKAIREEWEQRVMDANQPAWPKEGYIRQYGDEIVVNLGFPPKVESGKEQFINDWKRLLTGKK